MSSDDSHFLAVQGRGLITLPADLRRRHGLDEPGAQVEVREREDGVIELIPHRAVPADQRWFWTKEWQQMEREADEDIAAGRVTTYDSAEEFVDAMKQLVDP
ncbi:MAG: AbrB/MazE/SpoVT family DNA-binding domain-containing protein [Thermoleophilaceae bacterium]|nr:AbrB/MazE/SpoVT family DNA-binding domain-containing protein [Thermoleophilaceae bacterium]